LQNHITILSALAMMGSVANSLVTACPAKPFGDFGGFRCSRVSGVKLFVASYPVDFFRKVPTAFWHWCAMLARIRSTSPAAKAFSTCS
jgi:hypothetical protein